MLAAPSHASTPGVDEEAWPELSLGDLMKVGVESASRKSQAVSNTAAAVFVISASDIKRSGALTIPEVLHLAPGVEVARLGNNKFAVSIRGFNGRMANKLLVLVDGRNAFNPALSGVSWQDFQFPLEDIERIEVIRGPASAIWGSNGMNGVINIITRSAAATQGGQAGDRRRYSRGRIWSREMGWAECRWQHVLSYVWIGPASQGPKEIIDWLRGNKERRIFIDQDEWLYRPEPQALECGTPT